VDGIFIVLTVTVFGTNFVPDCIIVVVSAGVPTGSVGFKGFCFKTFKELLLLLLFHFHFTYPIIAI
jgi:hypothetical protein